MLWYTGDKCSYASPQIQRTCEAIHAAGCVKLRTFECILRQYEVQTVSMSTDLSTAQKAGGGKKRKQYGDGGAPAAAGSVSQTLARPSMAARGHTGYLLTARKAVPLD